MSLLDSVVVPVADPDDAATTASALDAADLDPGAIVVVYVVEKAGGAPDRTSVEQSEAHAEETFGAFEDVHPDAGTDVRYATDVVDGVFAAAADHDATAVAFLPRPGGRLVRFLTGDHALKLVTENDRPVIALPYPDR